MNTFIFHTRSPNNAARSCENAALVILKAASFSSCQLVCPQKDPLHGPVILQQCVARSPVMLSFLFYATGVSAARSGLTNEPCAAIEILCKENKPNLRTLVISFDFHPEITIVQATTNENLSGN